MNIGSVIMSKRKALGYTQQTLADKLNVSFQAVSKWENGTNYPEMEMLPMIASVLDTSIDSLLDISLLWFPIMTNGMTRRIIIGE